MTQQKIVGKVKKEYTPPSDPGWSRQWCLVSLSVLRQTTATFNVSLHETFIILVNCIRRRPYYIQENTGQTFGPSGLDLNVEPVWMQGITGDGVIVGIVDDGKYFLNHNFLALHGRKKT